MFDLVLLVNALNLDENLFAKLVSANARFQFDLEKGVELNANVARKEKKV